MRCSDWIERLVPILVCTFTVGFTNPKKERPIPVEYSCNSLPYILKDTELQFSYSAKHLKYDRCAFTITGKTYEQICVEFAQYYLDCDTEIILIGGTTSSLPRKTYSCDSGHSSDFCSTDTTLEVIFERRNGKQTDDFGKVFLKIYGKGKKAAQKSVNAIAVVGGIFGFILVLVVFCVLLYFRKKSSSQQRQQYPHEEIPLGPPPPYQESDPEETGATHAEAAV